MTDRRASERRDPPTRAARGGLVRAPGVTSPVSYAQITACTEPGDGLYEPVLNGNERPLGARAFRVSRGPADLISPVRGMSGPGRGRRRHASGRHPEARDIPRAASRTAGINAGTCASAWGTTTDTAATTAPPGPYTGAATDSASSVI